MFIFYELESRFVWSFGKYIYQLRSQNDFFSHHPKNIVG